MKQLMAHLDTDEDIDALAQEMEYHASLLGDGYWDVNKARELREAIHALASECKRRVRRGTQDESAHD